MLLFHFEIVETEIEWDSNYHLKFSDFNCIPDSNSHLSALTFYAISYDYKLSHDKFKIQIINSFFKNKSWIKVTDLNLLHHEQGHFNIAEIYTRKFRNTVIDSHFSYDKFDVEIDSIYQLYFDSCKAYQVIYDLETEHSILLEKQKIWDVKISNLLAVYKNYSCPFYEVKFL